MIIIDNEHFGPAEFQDDIEHCSGQVLRFRMKIDGERGWWDGVGVHTGFDMGDVEVRAGRAGKCRHIRVYRPKCAYGEFCELITD